MSWIYLAGLALAESPAWWTEQGVTRASALFGRAQARDSEAYDHAQDQLARAKSLVGALELADALLAPTAGRATYFSAMDRSLTGQFMRLQKHTDLLSVDYSRVFGAAVERAITRVAGEQTVTQCTSISKVEAMMGKGPKCPGTDISARLAAALDGDLVLQGQVASILTVDWPKIELSGVVQPIEPLSGIESTVDVAALARVMRADVLRDLDDEREAALEQIAEELSSADKVVKQAAIAKGEIIRTAWRSSVAAVGAGLWPEVKKKIEKGAKKGGPSGVGLCVNPQPLGGCGAPDVTAAVLERLTVP